MYLGINAAKIMTESAFTNKPPAAQPEIRQRCKNFPVALAEELQKLLPINQLIKDLKMLNPRLAISGDIPTLAPILTKLPNNPVNLRQDLDAQRRHLPLTSDIVGGYGNRKQCWNIFSNWILGEIWQDRRFFFNFNSSNQVFVISNF